MRFKTIAFTLIVSSAVFILGCDDEDSSTIGGGGQISFELSMSTPEVISLNILSGGAILYQGSTSPQSTGLSTGAIAVTKGQNVLVQLLMVFGSTTVCQNYQIESTLNGNQFDKRTFNMGIVAGVPCPDANLQTYNLIIP